MDVSIWKALTFGLASILTTGLVSWFSFGANAAPMEEVEKNERKIDLLRQSISGFQVSLGKIEANQENLRDLLQDHREDHGR